MNEKFLKDFFSVIDSMQAREFAARFTEDGRFYFANNAPACGHGEIAALAQGVFDQLKGIRHELVDWAVASSGKCLFEGRVTYLRKDGREIVLPFACAMLRDAEGRVKEYRSFVDVAPLFG